MTADIYLRHFQKDNILIQADDARLVLVFFFGSNVPGSPDLTADDIAFAQALLLEAIDKSYAMRYVHEIFNVFYMKLPDSPEALGRLIIDFAKKAAKNWFDHAAGADLSNPKIYLSVKLLIIFNFSSSWAMRMNGLDLTY